MTPKRFTVDSEGKYWDTVSNKYVTIDHLFYLVEKVEKENEELKQTIKTICKDYENHHGMDIRNAEWFTAW